MAKYIFGPVPSRRLGRSLGIDLTPTKTCSMDCRYCQLIPTTFYTTQRQKFCSPDEVLNELEQVLQEIAPPDWITISGSGEPTLHSELGIIIDRINALNNAPTCVITNSSLIFLEDVRQDLYKAKRVMPTLTTVNNNTFQFIHRPKQEISLLNILSGLQTFAKNYKGLLDVEIFICPGINDSKQEIEGLIDFLKTLDNIYSIYLNTSIRPARDKKILPATEEQLNEIKKILSKYWNVTTAYDVTPIPRRSDIYPHNLEDAIINLLKRHPCSLEQIELALGAPQNKIQIAINNLTKANLIEEDPTKLWKLKS